MACGTLRIMFFILGMSPKRHDLKSILFSIKLPIPYKRLQQGRGQNSSSVNTAPEVKVVKHTVHAVRASYENYRLKIVWSLS